MRVATSDFFDLLCMRAFSDCGARRVRRCAPAHNTGAIGFHLAHALLGVLLGHHLEAHRPAPARSSGAGCCARKSRATVRGRKSNGRQPKALNRLLSADDVAHRRASKRHAAADTPAGRRARRCCCAARVRAATAGTTHRAAPPAHPAPPRGCSGRRAARAATGRSCRQAVPPSCRDETRTERRSAQTLARWPMGTTGRGTAGRGAPAPLHALGACPPVHSARTAHVLAVAPPCSCGVRPPHLRQIPRPRAPERRAPATAVTRAK